MASTTFPQRRTGAFRGRWIGIGIGVVVLALVIAFVANRFARTAAVQLPATTAVATGNIVATVAGSGTVAAAQTLDLPFATSGTVSDVLVQTGDTVAKGQKLAQLDTRDLQLKVTSAEANLASAQAQMQQAQNGNATPEDIAAAKASVASATANATKTRTGDATAADIASAQAAVRSAEAKLDALKHPSADKVSAAQLSLTQAQNNLQSTRDSASAAKTKAQLDMEKAVEALTQAQSNYSVAQGQWQSVQDNGTNPTNPTTTDSSGSAKANKLNDAQKQQYYDAYVSAQSSMTSAEQSLEQARVAYDNARQQEVVDVQNAEAQLADAQQQFDALRNPSANDVTQAQATVDQAKASLQKLTQGGTKADIAAAQASIDQANANLAKLTAPATATDLQIQQASVTQAEQSLKEAQYALEQGTLVAPFDGVVTAVNVVPGSSGSSSSAAVTLMDRSTLHVDLKLSENDVAKVQVGQKVALSIDALKDWSAEGTVSYIAPSSETTNNVVTYAVRVSFPDESQQVKIGMTANMLITTDSKEDVLIVPSSALLPKGAGQAVQLLDATGKTSEVDVQTGLTDGTNTEIVSGVKVGDKVVTTPSTTTTSSSNRGGGFFRP